MYQMRHNIGDLLRKLLGLPTAEEEKKWIDKKSLLDPIFHRRINMEEMHEMESDGKDIGGYLATMYSRVEEDNSITGKIGRVRIVMFIEEKVTKPFGAD